MDRHFDPVVLRLIDLLKRALPDCEADDIVRGQPFVTGVLMLTLARTGASTNCLRDYAGRTISSR